MTPRAMVGTLACALALVPATTAGAADPSPAGANNWACKPSAAHPRRVVLVHGLGATMSENWGYVSPRLAAAGYCVYALTYGVNPDYPWFGGVVAMEQSSHELDAFVDRVLAATGAAQVDLVGHSEGTVMPRYWMKNLGGAPKVDKFVALTPLYQGTTLYGLAQAIAVAYRLNPSGAASIAAVFDRSCGSCRSFLAGSDFLTQLNAGGLAAPGVRYTNIMTRYDELVIPYTSGWMSSPQATNIVLQQQCVLDLSEHALVAFDAVAMRDILNALDPAHATPVRCSLR